MIKDKLRFERILWKSDIRLACEPTSMTIHARRFIGAWESTVVEWSPCSAAKYLNASSRYYRCLLYALSRSVNPVIRKVLREGLPLEAAVYVNPDWRLRCQQCNSLLSSVPCNECLMRSGRYGEGNWNCDDRFPTNPTIPGPTLHRPGTRAKFEVMCRRAERGEEVFSILDAKADLR